MYKINITNAECSGTKRNRGQSGFRSFQNRLHTDTYFFISHLIEKLCTVRYEFMIVWVSFEVRDKFAKFQNDNTVYTCTPHEIPHTLFVCTPPNHCSNFILMYFYVDVCLVSAPIIATT